jgi:hypothetical protein
MMENDKVRYMEESKNIIKRQTQVAYNTLLLLLLLLLLLDRLQKSDEKKFCCCSLMP